MRTICSTVLMILVCMMIPLKEGCCRSTARKVPWLPVNGLENDRLAEVSLRADTPQMSDKMPEPPKGLRQDRLPNLEIAELTMLASGVPSAGRHEYRSNHLPGSRRDRRFAPQAEPTVAQVPEMPQGMPGGMPPMQDMPGNMQMPEMPSWSENMPRMPSMPSSSRKRRSPKENKKGGKGGEQKKPEEKKHEEKKEKPGEKKDKPDEKPEKQDKKR